MNGRGFVRYDSCRCQCVGGNPCALRFNTHLAHVCDDPSCRCHQPESYGVVRVERAGRAVYVPLAQVFGVMESSK